MQTIIIKPQPGFQEQFLTSRADIVIGGGAAGVGKTFAELIEPLRHKNVKGFNAIFFRRTTVQIRNPGGLWDQSADLYPLFGGSPNSQQLEWWFETGVTIKFSHLEHEKNIYDHQGAQYCLIIFDELTHFTKKMFIYLLSRNRSMCGVKPYIRATCNPDPDSFVAELIEWWIDMDLRLPSNERNPNYGFPIRERAGKLRYFLIDNDNYVWGDNKQEVIDKCPHIFGTNTFQNIEHKNLIKSITFIPGNIYENKKLLEKDPTYLSNLLSQDADERARLLEGNWRIRIDELCIFHGPSIENLFTNIYPSNTNQRFITVDAARFGNDLCTIWVWYGWKVVKLIVLTKSDAQETVDVIEKERLRYEIPKGKVIVDQAGVGSGVVKLGRYIGFMGGAPAMVEPGTFIKENYKNLKTQCFYRYAERVNNDEVSLPLSNENVIVDGFFGVKIKIDGKMHDVRDLIKQDHRAIKRKEKNEEGKIQINSKEEQKILLKGRSPDFVDGLSMRSYFEFNTGQLNVGTATKSILDRL
jgi:hypothetical protein